MTRRRVIKATLVSGTLFLVAPFLISALSLSGLAVIAGLRSVSVSVPLPWVVFFDAPHFAVAYLFADLSRYLIFSSLALIVLLSWLILLVVRSGRALLRRKQFYLLTLGIVSVVGYAWFPSYEPAVQPTPGVQLQMVEQPQFIAAVVYRNWVGAEIEGCAFETLGWASANTLVYRKWCGGFFDPNNHYAWKNGTATTPRAYRVDARTDQVFTGDVTTLSRDTCLYWSCVRPLLAKDYVHTYSLTSRYPDAKDDSVLSPDGRWIAFRAKHVYGPEELLVIGQPETN